MVELLLTAIIYVAGAITEYESKGKVTQTIYYRDENSTQECVNVQRAS